MLEGLRILTRRSLYFWEPLFAEYYLILYLIFQHAIQLSHLVIFPSKETSNVTTHVCQLHTLRRELSEGFWLLHETFIALTCLFGSKDHATRGLEILAAMEKLNYDIRQAQLLLIGSAYGPQCLLWWESTSLNLIQLWKRFRGSDKPPAELGSSRDYNVVNST